MNDVVTESGFAFVQRLASELNKGEVKIPSFPDIVMRIRKALEDENCNVAKLTRLVATDPALAARLLSMSNSALMKRGGNSVNDLRTAINRLGSGMLRTAAMSLAVEQIFLGSSLGSHRKRLRKIWKGSANVAAISFAIARSLDRFNPDEALMAGLLHNVGKLYIVMHASDFEEFFSSEETLDAVVEQWHGQIGRVIIENWGFSTEMATAAADHMDAMRSVKGPADLTDLVTAAWLMSQPAANDDEAESRPPRAYTRLGLDEEKRAQIFREYQSDISALASALGG